MRIVIFGGTFNPIHNGHMKVIKSAVKLLSPDRFILMPAHIPPHKSAKDLVSDVHRINMCREAVKDIAGVEVSDYEMQLGGKSYTVNTLEHFRTEHPDDELCFLMGSDMLKSFSGWFHADRIMELASLAVFARNPEDAKTIDRDADEIVRKRGGKCVVLDCTPSVVSSTDIRARLMAYSNADGFIPKCVGDYIRKNNLYKFDRSKYTKYVSYLQKNLSEKRFRHSVNVANEALRLAVVYDCDRDRAYEAGLLHDTCKEIPYDKQLELVKRSSSFVDEVELAAPKTYHGIAASVYLKEHFGVDDEEILSAIRYHTVAKKGMTLLEKIIYIADLISVERDFDDVDYIRECTYRDINIGMYEALKFSVSYSCTHVRTIPLCTLEAYNEYTLYKLSHDKKNG